MSALGRLMVGRNDAICPHPERLRSNAIRVQGGRRGFICCPTCLEGFQALIASWHAHQVGPRGVFAQMFALGYTRGDALRFLAQLVADRIRLRLGLLRPEML